MKNHIEFQYDAFNECYVSTNGVKNLGEVRIFPPTYQGDGLYHAFWCENGFAFSESLEGVINEVNRLDREG